MALTMKTLYKILAAAGFMLAFAASASAATLTLSPSSATLKVGDTLNVDVMLDTQGAAIDGVDIQALNYNPYFMQLQDMDPGTSGVQISVGTLMPNTLANSADTTNGKIVFSQITNGGSTYTGSGKLVSLTFKALVAGTAKLTFDFTQGATTDTNVASQGTDILTAVTNGQYTINNVAGQPTQTPNSGPTGGSGGVLRLINDNGTYYLIIDGVRHGITNPGMLASYGFTFAMGQTATDADRQLPEGSILTPGNGALVKSKEDPTVYLISAQQRYGFVSAAVFLGLGFKFSSVLVVTDPELQILPRAKNLDDATAAHLPGLDIIKNGTVYYVGGDMKIHGYPSQTTYNSWHIPNDFSRVVPANDADFALGQGDLVEARNLQ